MMISEYARDVVVYKFPLTLTFVSQVVAIPKGAKVIAAHWQDQGIKLWAVVETSQKNNLENRQFIILPTGDIIHLDSMQALNHIDTLYIANSQLGEQVLHVFEMWDVPRGAFLVND